MRFLLQRIAFYLFTLWAAITLNFFIPRLIPGDPVQSLIAKNQGRLSSDAIHSLYVLFGLDKNVSLWDQYINYWKQLAHGDLGLSFTFYPTPVSEVIKTSLPWTVALVGVTTIVSFCIGTTLGVGAGWRRGSWIDNLLPVTTLLSSIPYFWLGLVAIELFTGPGSFFPSSNGYDPGLVPAFDQYFIPSAIRHSVLPAATILVSSVSGWMLGMRNMMVTVSSEDYITVAHAKDCRSGGSPSATPPATRCCPTCPASRWRWGSLSAAHCWSRSSSPTLGWASSSSRRSVRTTTR